MTYNVFGGMLNLAQSINYSQTFSIVHFQLELSLQTDYADCLLGFFTIVEFLLLVCYLVLLKCRCYVCLLTLLLPQYYLLLLLLAIFAELTPGWDAFLKKR